MNRLDANQKGIVSLLFILFMTVIATFVLTVGYSRLFLALQRGKGISDSLITAYYAESEINNLLARLISGYITKDSFPFSETKVLADGTKIELIGELKENEQILRVVSTRAFAVNEIDAVRSIETSSSINDVELVLVLDCTSSMDERITLPDGSVSTIMAEQKKAALNFIDSVAGHPDKNLFRVGIAVFGSNEASWIRSLGDTEVRPDRRLSTEEIRLAIENGFGNARVRSDDFYKRSPACGLVRDYTSIGSGFVLAGDYLNGRLDPKTKLVEILITDGRPNSRIVDSRCPPSVACISCQGREAYDFMECSLADTNTLWDGVHYGVRNPEIDAYSVTIYDSPEGEAVDIFREYSKAYFNANQAHELTGILEDVFENIVGSLSTITITRVIPVPE